MKALKIHYPNMHLIFNARAPLPSLKSLYYIFQSEVYQFYMRTPEYPMRNYLACFDPDSEHAMEVRLICTFFSNKGGI